MLQALQHISLWPSLDLGLPSRPVPAAEWSCMGKALVLIMCRTRLDDMLIYTLQVNHEDFNEGIIQVQAKKKANLSYYA